MIRRIVTEPLRTDPKRVHTPDGCGDNLEQAARRYETAIHAVGRVNAQILGAGSTRPHGGSGS